MSIGDPVRKGVEGEDAVPVGDAEREDEGEEEDEDEGDADEAPSFCPGRGDADDCPFLTAGSDGFSTLAIAGRNGSSIGNFTMPSTGPPIIVPRTTS